MTFGSFKGLLDDYCQCFLKHGSFELRKGEKIHSRAREEHVPKEPGVYLIFDSQGGKLLYIGRAGTLCRNGTFKDHMLIDRLSATRKGIGGQKFYERKMAELQLDALVFYWFVTWADNVRIIPAKAKADLLQACIDEHGYLPEWNEAC